jgi:hypothetical protein
MASSNGCWDNFMRCMTYVAKIAPDQPKKANRISERCLRTHERCRKSAGLGQSQSGVPYSGGTVGADIVDAKLRLDNAAAQINARNCKAAFTSLFATTVFMKHLEVGRKRAPVAVKRLNEQFSDTMRTFGRRCVRKVGR